MTRITVMDNSKWHYVRADEQSPLAAAVDGLLINPFRGIDHEDMEEKIQKFLRDTNLGYEYKTVFRKGGHLALSMGNSTFPGLQGTWNGNPEDLEWSDQERRALHCENSRRKLDKFKQPILLYLLIGCCSLGAATQGWDETAINQAQVYYQNIGLDWISGDYNWKIGLVNSAPYLCCAVLGCWLSDPLNKLVGRRGAIFIACVVSCITCIWQALARSWWDLLIARFFLGFGIGIKSATVPVYASECTPKYIRGGLVMSWQMWTAFGIMLGYLSGVIFEGVDPNIRWRLIIGSPAVFPIIVCLYIYTLPESPRWLLNKARGGKQHYYEKAYRSLKKLRNCEAQAARDIFFTYHMLEQEGSVRTRGSNRLKELFIRRRNRRALIASIIVMVMQQMCGVNVFEYYSSEIFARAGYHQKRALQISAGFGIINFIFAIPAIHFIDSFGRRNLLLVTFPFLGIFQLVTGLGFLASNTDTKKAVVTTGMYLFCLAYSPGEGPVPFVYSSESMPFYVRDLGMSLVTAVNWAFNFLLSITFPPFLRVFGYEGAFAYYAGWCFVGWFLILLFVPETKNLTLEQLDVVFAGRSRDHAIYGLRQVRYWVLAGLLRREDVEEPPALVIADPATKTGPSSPRRMSMDVDEDKIQDVQSEHIYTRSSGESLDLER